MGSFQQEGIFENRGRKQRFKNAFPSFATAFPVLSACVRKLTQSGKDSKKQVTPFAGTGGLRRDLCQTQLPSVKSHYLYGCPSGRDGNSCFPEEYCLWQCCFFKFYKITSWFCFLFL